MNRTCRVCGLIFQTATDRGFVTCHRCFIKHLETMFMLVLPHLYEISDQWLSELVGLTNTMHECAVLEKTRRNGYVAQLQKKVRVG